MDCLKLFLLSYVFLIVGCERQTTSDNKLYYPIGTFAHFGNDEEHKLLSNQVFTESLKSLKEGKFSDYLHNKSIFRLFVLPGGESIASNYLFRLEQKKQGYSLEFKASRTGSRIGLSERFEQNISTVDAHKLVEEFEKLNLCMQPIDTRGVYDGEKWLFEGYGSGVNEANDYCVRVYISRPENLKMITFQDKLFSHVPEKYSKYRP